MPPMGMMPLTILSSNTRPNYPSFCQWNTPQHTHILQNDTPCSTIKLTPFRKMFHSCFTLTQVLIRVAAVGSGKWGSCSTGCKPLVLYRVDGQLDPHGERGMRLSMPAYICAFSTGPVSWVLYNKILYAAPIHFVPEKVQTFFSL